MPTPRSDLRSPSARAGPYRREPFLWASRSWWPELVGRSQRAAWRRSHSALRLAPRFPKYAFCWIPDQPTSKRDLGSKAILHARRRPEVACKRGPPFATGAKSREEPPGGGITKLGRFAV